MDVRQMKQVLSIGRQGSFSAAAKELGIAQPTLSKSIARLEDELGVKLFDRSGWRAQMTPMGEFLIGQAASLVDDANRLDRNIQLIARGEIGAVKIGFGPALRSTFMQNLAAKVLEHHPGLRLTVMSENAIELLRGVMSGAFDLIILAASAADREPSLIQYDVLSARGMAVACPGHPLAGKRKISINEFASYPLIGSANTSGSPPQMYAMPELTQGRRVFEPRIVCNDLDSTLEMVRRGLGIYAGAEHIVGPVVEAGTLVQLDVDWSFTYRAVAAMTPAASLSPMLRQIVEYAREAGAELLSPSRQPLASGPRRFETRAPKRKGRR